MPYDLYGNYYAKEIDAMNAEMAQCAEIDSRIASKKISQLERQLQQQQYLDYELHEKVDFLMAKVEELEKRIAQMEHTLC